MSQVGLMHPHNLLTQAIDQAHAVEDERVRAEFLEGLAHVAVAQGAGGLARELLLDLADVGARGATYMALAERALADGDHTQARADLEGARAAAESGKRWAPRPDWLSAGQATARVVSLRVRIGEAEDLQVARRWADQLVYDGVAGARSRIAIAAATRGEEPDAQAWDQARAAIATVRDAADRRRLVVEFAEAVVAANDPVGATVLAREAVSADSDMDWLNRMVLLRGVGQALARAGWLDAASWACNQALDLAIEGRHDAPRLVGALCGLAQAMVGPLGADAAGEAVDIALEVLVAVPLDAEALAPAPWGLLRECVDAHPELAKPLHARLAAMDELPPAWRFVRARLALQAGSQRAALDDAAVLAELGDDGATLSALVRVGGGELLSGRRQMAEALSACAEGAEVRVPMGRGERLGVELAFVRALLGAGSVGGARELAMLVTDPIRRAALLVEVAEAAHARGELRSLRATADAALGELSGDAGLGLSAAPSLLRLALLRGQIGDPEAAGAAVTQLVAATAATDVVGALRVLGDCTRRLRARKLGVLANSFSDAALARLVDAETAEARCGGVLAWLEGLTGSLAPSGAEGDQR